MIKLMDRRPLKTRDKAWPTALAKLLLKCQLTPNLVSLLSVAFAAIAGVALGWFAPCSWALLLAAVGIQGRLLCNLLDGLMAVEGGAKTKTGELYNEIPDRFADGIILTATGYAVGVPWMGWLATALALLTAYLRALRASLGHGQDYSGPGAKPQRMFFLTIGCVVQAIVVFLDAPTRVLWVALWAVIALTAVTAWLRMFRLARLMNSTEVSTK
jgi:phosphatidylglycerophosphate synthase